jgi:hypothetical protein
VTTLQELQLEGYTLTSQELISRLNKLGIDDLHIDALKMWSKEKLIPPVQNLLPEEGQETGTPWKPREGREGREDTPKSKARPATRVAR